LLRFGLIFGGCLAAAYALITTGPVNRGLIQPYLELSAKISAALLRALGFETIASGTAVASSEFVVWIKRGCDAIDPTVLFMSAVLASPVSLSMKVPGLIAGLFLLLSLNLVRIVSLFLVGLYEPNWFATLHVTIWQPVFLVVAVAGWLAWATWARHQPLGRARPDHT